VKLRFDENISHRILKKLNPEFENSIHCKSIKPYPKNDFDIWNHAKENEYLIVTFDEDFYEWMLL
jgi:predicted nuclease of predicted toxin-antitoxin system